MTLDDRDLLQRIAAGDGDAWSLLYERHVSTVWRYVAARVGGDVHITEDVVSEIMLTLARQLPKIDTSRGNLSSWLLGVARNKVADHFRKEQRRQRTDADWSERSSSNHPDTSLDLDSSVEFALTQISNDETLVLLWKYAEEMSVRQIAARLGKTEKAVESILFRARHSFRAAYLRRDGTQSTSTTRSG